MEIRSKRWFTQWKIQILILLVICTSIEVKSETYVLSNKKATEHHVNIPSSNAAEALNLLAEQTQALLIFPYDIAESRMARAVIGNYSIKEALDLILNGSGLIAEISDKGVIRVRIENNVEITNKKRNGMNTKKTILASMLAALFTTSAASAQDNTDNKAEESEEKSGFMEQIIVTGSSSSGLTALETSYGVAVLDADNIVGAPVGLTDLVDSIPGLQGEFSNGETNSNLNVRGTQGGFMSFISLQEDGLPVQYSPFLAEFELRYDLSYDRVEAVLGGPSGIFTAQGSGATLNYISRIARKPEGDVRVSVTDYGQHKTELFYGAPIGDNGWFGSVGGTFRQGDGVRDLGFTASSGGQIRANLIKEFAQGQFTIAYKKIDDKTPYYNPVPTFTGGSNSQSPTSIPGFDLQKHALSGPDTRYLNAKGPDGFERRDMADGNVSQTDQLTLGLEYDFDNGFSISNKFRTSSIVKIAHDLRSGGDSSGGASLLFEAEDYVDSKLSILQAGLPDAGITSAELVRVNDGQIISDPSSLNGNGLVTINKHSQYAYETDFLVNDFRVNWENSKGTIFVTGGIQSWDVNTYSDNAEDELLIDIKNQAERYDVTGYDAEGNIAGHLTDAGVTTYGSLDNHGSLQTDSTNYYINAEIDITDDFRIDFGARHEVATITGFSEDIVYGVLIPEGQGNNILADDSRAVTRNGHVYTGSVDYNTDSLTFGGNYTITDNLAIYARWASSEDMAANNEFAFYSIPGWGGPDSGQPAPNAGLNPDPTELEFAEVGVRYQGDFVSGYATYFDTTHKNSGNVEVNENGTAKNVYVDTIASGLEFWFDFNVMDNLTVNVSGVQMTSEQQGAGDVPATATPRLPETQIRIAPTLTLGNAEIIASVQHYGSRAADRVGTSLPAYTQINLGVNYPLNNDINLSLMGNNLTDELGFTSGNFRGVDQAMQYRYNSVIPGRTITFTAHYSF
ncbi:TonB-dependent receptor domain-containing protein [Paraglaciecola sp.]|uniref:TonB-dependent siderophore receptor n=1 Tax=Paraglaciecola sp. TaxID=1920173 RepID=UPI003EF7AC7D